MHHHAAQNTHPNFHKAVQGNALALLSDQSGHFSAPCLSHIYHTRRLGLHSL
ncbi:Uncharacterised protein [Vibrio cholerae]|nr:Uncharacterised protein [Vibrio cholerae]